MKPSPEVQALREAVFGKEQADTPQTTTIEEKDFRKWCIGYRPYVEGKIRKYMLPMWDQIYADAHSFIMIVGGRQIFKSTYFGDRLAYTPTIRPGSTAVYVTRDDESLSSFSNDKYRQAVLEDNPRLRALVKGSTFGQVHRVAFRNGSKVYLVTDERGFKHVEGKSPDELILDEGQDLEWSSWTRIREAQATTQGKVKIGGIGGEQGSEYYNFWRTTNQNRWKPDHETWRDKLEFNNEGLVWGDYLLDVCGGDWEPQEPENYLRHGYWLPQMIFPHIPLKKTDAIEKYKIDVEFSIEWKEENYPQTLLLQHVYGQFYEGTKRPVTPDMVYACMRPYNYLELWTPEQVRLCKTIFGRDIVILMGVDFGSGNVGSSKTVATVMIKWQPRPELGYPVPRYQVVFIADDPPQAPDDQAEWLAKLALDYGVESAIGDLGYGEQIIYLVQHGGRNRVSGEEWKGVGSRIFKGCWTRNDPVAVMKSKQDESDTEGKKPSHILIDKTHSLQLFIDHIQRYAAHPLRKEEEWLPGEAHINNARLKYARSQFIIPYGTQRKVEWLVKEFTSIARKDIEEEDIAKEDKRQRAKKEFMHPPDSVMSFIYCLVADKHHDPDAYGILGVRRKFY